MSCVGKYSSTMVRIWDLFVSRAFKLVSVSMRDSSGSTRVQRWGRHPTWESCTFRGRPQLKMFILDKLTWVNNIIYHPYIGMVTIPTIYDDWMVCYLFYPHFPWFSPKTNRNIAALCPIPNTMLIWVVVKVPASTYSVPENRCFMDVYSTSHMVIS